MKNKIVEAITRIQNLKDQASVEATFDNDFAAGEVAAYERSLDILTLLATGMKPASGGCPRCGSENISDTQAAQRERAGRDDEPPFKLVCEQCRYEWEETS